MSGRPVWLQPVSVLTAQSSPPVVIFQELFEEKIFLRNWEKILIFKWEFFLTLIPRVSIRSMSIRFLICFYLQNYKPSWRNCADSEFMLKCPCWPLCNLMPHSAMSYLTKQSPESTPGIHQPNAGSLKLASSQRGCPLPHWSPYSHPWSCSNVQKVKV